MKKDTITDAWKLLCQHIPGGVFHCKCDDSLSLLWASGSFYSLTGYTEEELNRQYGGSLIPIVHPSDQKALRELAGRLRLLSPEGPAELELRIIPRNQCAKWVICKICPMPDGMKTLSGLIVDISIRKQAEDDLRLSLERYHVIMDQITNIVFEWDLVKDTLFLSPNWEKKFGYKAPKREIQSLLLRSPRIFGEDIQTLAKIMDEIRQGTQYTEAELRIANLAGEFTWCRIQASTLYSGERRPIKAVGVILDIAEEKRQREMLLKAAKQDALTGLLNKTETRHRCEQCLSGHDSMGSLVLIDLDDFKHINDQYGHLCGDAVLSDTAAALRRYTRSGDILGRIGGDEFLLFLPGMPKEGAERRVLKISSLLKKKRLPNPEDSIRISVGIASWPMDARDFMDLYHKADMALYHSKRNGKDIISLYRKELEAKYRETGNVAITRTGAFAETKEMNRVDQELVNYTFSMLYHSQDIETAVTQLLEIVGRAYDVSRVYIFESSPDGAYCNNTFEWCNQGVTPQIGQLQNISYKEDLNNYLDNFDENGVFYCEDIHNLNRKLYDILAPQEVKSMLQCAIIDDREFKGYVGFDECRQNRYWTEEQTRSLGLIANILAEFLLKHRLKEQVRELVSRRGNQD